MSNINTVPVSSINCFYNMINDIEECPAKEGWGYRLFPVTNEESEDRTLRIMSKKPIVGNVVLATSGFFVLNLVSVRPETIKNKIEYIILADHSKSTELFWKIISNTIKTANNSNEFSCLLFKVLMDNANRFYDDETYLKSKNFSVNSYAMQTLANIHKETKSGLSWWSSEEKFNRIKKIFVEERFIFKRLDLSDKNSMEKVAKAINATSGKLDTIYFSNVRQYCEDDNRLNEFRESVDALRQSATDQTYLIDTTPTIFLYSYGVTQRVITNICRASLSNLCPASPKIEDCLRGFSRGMPLLLFCLKLQFLLNSEEFKKYFNK